MKRGKTEARNQPSRFERRRTRVPMALIKTMTDRIVHQFRPERVILFGSYARGDAGPDSDVDLLVVMPVETSRRAKAVEIGVALHDIAVPTDVFVSTPEEYAWRKEIFGTLEYPAETEGRVLYAKR